MTKRLLDHCVKSTFCPLMLYIYRNKQSFLCIPVIFPEVLPPDMNFHGLANFLAKLCQLIQKNGDANDRKKKIKEQNCQKVQILTQYLNNDVLERHPSSRTRKSLSVRVTKNWPFVAFLSAISKIRGKLNWCHLILQNISLFFFPFMT